VDENETPRDDTRLKLNDESGMTRRDLMRRGAVVGGTLLWVAPAIQSISSKAYAQTTGSGLCEVCLATTVDPDGPGPLPPVAGHVPMGATAACCACVAANGGGVVAVLICAITQQCLPSGPPAEGAC
jgi:hypothetical protein